MNTPLGPHPWEPDDETRKRLDFGTKGKRAETSGSENPAPDSTANRADPAGHDRYPRAALPGEGDPARVTAPRGARRRDDNAQERPVLVELYGKPGCHLCDEARPVVEEVVAKEGATLVEHDILADPALTEKYGEYIPVVLIDGRQHATWRVNAGMLTRAIRAARRGRGRWWGRRIKRLR